MNHIFIYTNLSCHEFLGTYKIEINATVDRARKEFFGRTVYTCNVKPAFASRAKDFSMG